MYATSLITFLLQFLCHALKALFFYQNSPKIKLVLQKKENFQALGTPPPDTAPCEFYGTIHREFLATRLVTKGCFREKSTTELE